ncbi:unnamed protein product [Boreogadus saida]
MACRRKDSFLWGRAERTPLKSSRPPRGDPGDNVQTLQEPERVAVETPVSAELGEQKKNTLRNRIFLCGKKKFNMDPKKPSPPSLSLSAPHLTLPSSPVHHIDKDPIGIIPLENLSVRPVHDPTKRYCLELSSCGGQKVKACKVEAGGLVEGKHRAYRLSAASRAEQDGWVASIRSSISKDPFYDLVTSRRRKVTGSSNSRSAGGGPRSEPQS